MSRNDALICTIEVTKSEKKERIEEKKRNDKSISKDKKKKLHSTAGKSNHPEACSKTNLQEEKSSLTEEHGTPCSDSDSTQSSAQRKRHSSPPNANNTTYHNSGTDMPAVKLNSLPKWSLSMLVVKLNSDVEVLNSNAAHCLVKLAPRGSNKADVEDKHSTHIIPLKSRNGLQQLNISKGKVPCPHKKIDTKLQKRKYQALFQNLVPVVPMEVTDEEEEDWLVGSSSSKKEECQSAKRTKPSGNALSIQPRAHYLSDVDLYALPFTLPF